MGVELVMIGGSAGSLEIILESLPGLKENLPFPIVVVLHRKTVNPSGLETLFSYKTNLRVLEIEDKMPLANGKVFIAPIDYHLLIESDRTFALDLSEKVHYSRPSIDVAMESACDVFGSEMCGILLSGANVDGAEGMRCLAENGATVAIQEPESCLVKLMPAAAKKLIPGVRTLRPEELAPFINSLGPEIP